VDVGTARGRILLVEDDRSLREVVRISLTREGYQVLEAGDGRRALELFSLQQPDLVLLDVMLPLLDGFEVCREIRRSSLIPIIMLTARADTVDVVVGLESGADDYVTKPFEFPELLARIRAVLRRARGPQTETATVRLGPLELDPDSYTARRAGEPLHLTATEFRLLAELARHRGMVLTRDQLLERVWGYHYLGDSRLVDVHIQRLRAKVEEDAAHPALILTVRGIGYRAAP
jgi:two-component system response regulator MtrA